MSLDDVDPMSNYDKFVASEYDQDSVKTELDYYLEEPVIPRKVDL